MWGYSYSFATVLVFLQQDPAWSENSIASLSAIGSVQLGVQFLMPYVVDFSSLLSMSSD